MAFLYNSFDKFEFVRVASLRAAQLMRGCTGRVSGSLKATTTARREVAAGLVSAEPRKKGPSLDLTA